MSVIAFGITLTLDVKIYSPLPEGVPEGEARGNSLKERYFNIQYSTVQYSTVQYSTIQYSTVMSEDSYG